MKLGITTRPPRLGCKLRIGLHSSSAGRFGADRINDRYFDRNMKSAAPIGCAFSRAARLRVRQGI
jgi:hypothetical protein